VTQVEPLVVVSEQEKAFIHFPVRSYVKNCGDGQLGFPIHVKNFSQSEHIIGYGSHVEFPTSTKNSTL